MKEIEWVTWYVWPEDTACTAEDLEEYLTFMSDDYITCRVPVGESDSVPAYDFITTLLTV